MYEDGVNAIYFCKNKDLATQLSASFTTPNWNVWQSNKD